MTNAMWLVGASSGAPLTEDEVRQTTEPIRVSDAAKDTDTPDWNERESDQSPELTGLSRRMLAPHTVDTVKSAPWWDALATDNHNARIDNQVATSGTAAAREQAGQFGHGTMQYSESLEPVIREGAAMGNDYFVVNDKVVQEGAGEYMRPDPNGEWLNAMAAKNAAAASRQAAQASLYANFFGGQ